MSKGSAIARGFCTLSQRSWRSSTRRHLLSKHETRAIGCWQAQMGGWQAETFQVEAWAAYASCQRQPPLPLLAQQPLISDHLLHPSQLSRESFASSLRKVKSTIASAGCGIPPPLPGPRSTEGPKSQKVDSSSLIHLLLKLLQPVLHHCAPMRQTQTCSCILRSTFLFDLDVSITRWPKILASPRESVLNMMTSAEIHVCSVKCNAAQCSARLVTSYSHSLSYVCNYAFKHVYLSVCLSV